MPAEDQDHQLLRRYVEDASHQAFSELVRRHVALVHSAALRQMGNPHDAEDVTEAVFIALAKNSRVRREQVVAGWLVTASRHLASNAKRQAARRRQHELR